MHNRVAVSAKVDGAQSSGAQVGEYVMSPGWPRFDREMNHYTDTPLDRLTYDLNGNLSTIEPQATGTLIATLSAGQPGASTALIAAAQQAAAAGGSWLDLALGSDVITNDDGTMQDTAQRTMSGAGHQHFLKFFRELVSKTKADHLRRTLFSRWDYSDEGRGMNLRWDPLDDRRYALRREDPSSDPVRTMRGANRLAIEALPLLATQPTSDGLYTCAVQGSGRRDTFFLWPIWAAAIDVHVVRSVMGQVASLKKDASARAARGVAAMYSSARITTGKFRNFTPATPL